MGTTEHEEPRFFFILNKADRDLIECVQPYRLEERLPVRSGDGLIVLAFSPVTLIGGGRVLLSRCRRSRDLSAGERALLGALDAGDRAATVAAWLGLQRLPAPAAAATRALDLSGAEAAALLHGTVSSGDADRKSVV